MMSMRQKDFKKKEKMAKFVFVHNTSRNIWISQRLKQKFLRMKNKNIKNKTNMFGIQKQKQKMRE